MTVDWRKIEGKWQEAWEKSRLFEADPDPSREKRFVTFPYPYMNGPLHVGHGFTAARVDAYARFKRMQGYNVLFPWAWHWTGQPITAAAERLGRGDPAMVREFREIDRVPEEEIRKFVDPVYMAEYYTAQSRETVKRIGFSVDWRREFHTTSLEPAFSRFIEWQYAKLEQRGYVAKGTHPVVWCPRDESPTGDHDRLEGEGVQPEEYVLMKFRLEDAKLVAATFRPETIYGVTNLWVNPDVEYVEATVDGERWIISPEGASKLKEQLRDVKVERKSSGRSLIGKKCASPIDGRPLPILPGWFVDANAGSGVVYSVPAHAPFDWVALRELKQNPKLLADFGLEVSLVEEIEPISMIRLEGFGQFPAIEIVDRLGVKDQKDPKCDEATAELYRKEFHSGILKEICGTYSGMKVSEVKKQIIGDFKRRGYSDIMYDLPQKVVCRCMTRCIVKVLEGQWFLRYSDEEWKKRTNQLLDKTRILPENARQWFRDVIVWLKEWPCARKTGLGTPLPWSPDWIVETLSDSTIYMAFYTISHQIRKNAIQDSQLTEEVFDFIFLGEGNSKMVAAKSKIDVKVLEAMREEFLYWYPVDLRNSAKELLPNHLSFFLFHHAAIFPPEKWPRMIGVNGMMMLEGAKMSKSKGNVALLRTMVEDHGADVTRCTMLLGGEDMDDANWRSETIREVSGRLESLYNLYGSLPERAEDRPPRHLETWLMGVLQERVRKVTESLETLKTRTALETALFEVWNDLRWYLRRCGRPNRKTVTEFLNIWLRLLAPFTPHLAEEVWMATGHREFVSVASWPTHREDGIDLKAEAQEELVKQTLEDTLSILKATKVQPKRTNFYTASHPKWKAYLKILEKPPADQIKPDELLREFSKDEELRQYMSLLAKTILKIAKEITSLPPQIREKRLKAGIIDEKSLLGESKDFFSKELKCQIEVYSEESEEKQDPKNKAPLAQPYRPAIYIE